MWLSGGFRDRESEEAVKIVMRCLTRRKPIKKTLYGSIKCHSHIKHTFHTMVAPEVINYPDIRFLEAVRLLSDV